MHLTTFILVTLFSAALGNTFTHMTPDKKAPQTVSNLEPGVYNPVNAMITPAPQISQSIPLLPQNSGGLDRLLATNIPASVTSALVHDSYAPESLANQFSGDISPQWFSKLAEDVEILYFGTTVLSAAPKFAWIAPRGIWLFVSVVALKMI